MAQLIASNQLTLTNINDGKTSYHHWAYANSADGTLDFNTDYKSAVGLDILNVINWEKNTSMSNSTLKLSSNADGSFKVTGKGTAEYEVLSKSFQVKAGDKLRFTVHYTNRLAFWLYNNYGLQFVVNNAYTESITSTSKIVLPNKITWSTEYQLEYTATTSNIWMQLNFGDVLDASQVDFDVKIEVENLTNPVKYAYMGTYTDYTATDSTVPTKYTWSRILGSNGQTSYHHWAYSDNADGTGLTLTDNGQRYMGYYTDYTQADSTDKTKYRWADRWAKIEVGGRNIIRNSAFGNATNSGPSFTVGGVTYPAKSIPNWNNLYNSGIRNPTTSYHAIYKESFEGKGPVIEFNESNGSRNWKALSTILRASELSFGNYTFSADIYATGTGTKIWFGFYYYNKSGVTNFHSGQTTVYITTINKWNRVAGQIKLNDDIDLSKEVNFYIYAYGFTTNSILYLTKPQLEEGIIPTPYGEAQSDIDERIDTKADQALTQKQLNMLIEKAQLMQTELKARVAMETLSDLERAYNAYVEANDKAVEKSQADLIEAGRRVDAMVETLGGLSKTKKFIDTYIKEAEEGITIGTNDNVSHIRIIYDRIAMYSAGKEVMYISQGVIHIDNGVFTKTLQIGRFRTEQHQTNLDINVCRYVG